jgi:hypothetical protein
LWGLTTDTFFRGLKPANGVLKMFRLVGDTDAVELHGGHADFLQGLQIPIQRCASAQAFPPDILENAVHVFRLNAAQAGLSVSHLNAGPQRGVQDRVNGRFLRDVPFEIVPDRFVVRFRRVFGQNGTHPTDRIALSVLPALFGGQAEPIIRRIDRPTLTLFQNRYASRQIRDLLLLELHHRKNGVYFGTQAREILLL